jgi:predicted ATPase
MKISNPFLIRVRLRNYKSIAACDVRLGPLTLLIGPNGSGKSNFVDALNFVADEALLRPHARPVKRNTGSGDHSTPS